MEDVMKRLNYQPSSLTNYELENPENVIECFFENYSIHEIRENLWELYKSWTYHDSEYTDTGEIRAMILFYTQIIGFLNASFITTEKRKEAQ
ncbi:hypothetical protein [Pedobacter nyackensis]|uniref:Uncharacterized protein n=1 Tax=Pedobacter nyackensis TaxID=475255 RepID=A0A1W2DCS8_9SPHI|nr:hypothetical protein [Pedobacter nyackensis]SMC95074.1 hypothetical protein SAMN04488101_106174 [Pedobacter nyackensis]